MTHEIVTKPAFEPKRKVEFLTLLRFIIQCTVVVVAIALLSCVLAVLNIMSVFAVSTALEDFPVSEILLAERSVSLISCVFCRHVQRRIDKVWILVFIHLHDINTRHHF